MDPKLSAKKLQEIRFMIDSMEHIQYSAFSSFGAEVKMYNPTQVCRSRIENEEEVEDEEENSRGEYADAEIRVGDDYQASIEDFIPTTYSVLQTGINTPSLYGIGEIIEARFEGGENYFKGKISCINNDGTFNISYDDGDREINVHQDLVRSIDSGYTLSAKQPQRSVWNPNVLSSEEVDTFLDEVKEYVKIDTALEVSFLYERVHIRAKHKHFLYVPTHDLTSLPTLNMSLPIILNGKNNNAAISIHNILPFKYWGERCR